MAPIRHDLARNVLAILCIIGLIGLSLWVLRPFLAAGLWAATIVVATWPLFRQLEARLGGRRLPAIGAMSLAMLLLLVLPLWLAVDTIAVHGGQLVEAARQLGSGEWPAAPGWLAGLPLVGEALAGGWNRLLAVGGAEWLAKASPYAADAGKWLLAQVGGLGGMLIQFFLIVAMAAIFYAEGEAAARLALRFGYRLAGERGENSIVLAAQAIRGVALGVGVTAIVQTLLGGLGLALAGVPFAAPLSALMLMLCIAQVGPSPVLLAAVAWMYWTGDNGWATFLLVWSLVVTSLDNFLRPMLIRRGADLSLLLIFAGVIGGMLGFGLVGIFIGPVVLAVGWTLLQAWIAELPEHAGRPAERVGDRSAPAEPDDSEPAAG